MNKRKIALEIIESLQAEINKLVGSKSGYEVYGLRRAINIINNLIPPPKRIKKKK